MGQGMTASVARVTPKRGAWASECCHGYFPVMPIMPIMNVALRLPRLCLASIVPRLARCPALASACLMLDILSVVPSSFA